MTRTACLALLSLVLAAPGAHASLDLTIADCGLSLGNSPQLVGLRLNAVDDGVQSVSGLNVTVWTPTPNPEAAYRGATIGLIGPKGRSVDGLALGGLGVVAHRRLLGLGAATYGVATDHLWGAGTGLVLVEARKSLVGAALAGLRVRAPQRVWGIAASGAHTAAGSATGVVFSGGLAASESMRGLQVGTIAATKSLTGAALGLLYAGAEDMRGLAVGLGGAVTGDVSTGIAAGGLAAYAGSDLTGAALSAGFAGSAGHLRGLLIGGIGGFAGLFNGAMVQEINMEDFLVIDKASDRHAGLAVGLVNYTRRLHGVQLGLLNWAGNNPRWLRLLPLANVHV